VNFLKAHILMSALTHLIKITCDFSNLNQLNLAASLVSECRPGHEYENITPRNVTYNLKRKTQMLSNGEQLASNSLISHHHNSLKFSYKLLRKKCAVQL
jgi:hypothetical protein